MRRYNSERGLLRQRQLFYAQHVLGEVDTDRSGGYFRKRNVLDCGNPRCGLCHGSKVHGLKTVKMQRDDEDFRDQLADL